MAKKAAGQNAYSDTVNYAEVRLTQSDRDAFLNWMQGVKEDLSTGLLRILDSSSRVTFKFDYHNACHMCTWSQQDTKDVNAGLTIISRSDDPEEAFWLNVYKVFVMYEGQRLPDQKQSNSWG